VTAVRDGLCNIGSPLWKQFLKHVDAPVTRGGMHLQFIEHMHTVDVHAGHVPILHIQFLQSLDDQVELPPLGHIAVRKGRTHVTCASAANCSRPVTQTMWSEHWRPQHTTQYERCRDASAKVRWQAPRMSRKNRQSQKNGRDMNVIECVLQADRL